MSSGVTYDNSGILAGTVRALTVSTTGNIGIGYKNNSSVSSYELDVSGVLNTTKGINLSYTTTPTFTANQVGYQFIVYENKTLGGVSFSQTNICINMLTHAVAGSGDLTTSGKYVSFPPGIWIVEFKVSYMGNTTTGIGYIYTGLTTDYTKFYSTTGTATSNGLLGTPFGSGTNSYSQNDYFVFGPTSAINTNNYGYMSGTVVVNCTNTKSFLWVGGCTNMQSGNPFQVVYPNGEQGVLIATRIA